MQPRPRTRANLPAKSRYERRPRTGPPCRHCNAEPGGQPTNHQPCPADLCPAQLCGPACLQQHLEKAHPNLKPPPPAVKAAPPRRRRNK